MATAGGQRVAARTERHPNGLAGCWGVAERQGARGVVTSHSRTGRGVAAGQRVAVRAECHRNDLAGAGEPGPTERFGMGRVGDIPQLDRPVGRAAGQRAPIGAECHRIDRRFGLPGRAERHRVRGVGDIPQPDRPVVVAAGQRVAVRAERHRAIRAVPLVRGGPSGWGCAGSVTSHSWTAVVVAAAGQRVPIVGERHRIDRATAAGQRPAGRLHSRAVASLPPLASVWPLGLNATE